MTKFETNNNNNWLIVKINLNKSFQFARDHGFVKSFNEKGKKL